MGFFGIKQNLEKRCKKHCKSAAKSVAFVKGNVIPILVLRIISARIATKKEKESYYGY